jgi:hypothetical protein
MVPTGLFTYQGDDKVGLCKHTASFSRSLHSKRNYEIKRILPVEILDIALQKFYRDLGHGLIRFQ